MHASSRVDLLKDTAHVRDHSLEGRTWWETASRYMRSCIYRSCIYIGPGGRQHLHICVRILIYAICTQHLDICDIYLVGDSISIYAFVLSFEFVRLFAERQVSLRHRWGVGGGGSGSREAHKSVSAGESMCVCAFARSVGCGYVCFQFERD